MTNEELCKSFQSGNADALEALYNQNRGLIELTIKKYCAFEDPDDLRQESFFAIRQAALLWDHSKGALFSTYCAYWITQAAQRYIYSCAGTIRAPVHAQEKIRLYKRAASDYYKEFGRDPTAEELCYILEVNPQQLKDLQRAMLVLNPRRTSEPIGEEGESELEDFLKDDRDPISDTIDRIQNEELHEAIEKELQRIPKREADTIRRRYYGGLTLKQTADIIGISTERARQLEAKALRKLRHPKAAKRLQAYLTDGAAYSEGLKRAGLQAFKKDWASAQERAVIRMEEKTGRIWQKIEEGAIMSLNTDFAT